MSDSDVEAGPEEWSDWEGSDHGLVQSLFSADTFPSVEEALQFDASHHGFDLLAFRSSVRFMDLDMYGTIKLINYLRKQGKEGAESALALDKSACARPWDADEYFAPVLEDDALLSYDWEGDDEEGEEPASSAAPFGKQTLPGGSSGAEALETENAALKAAVQALQAALLADTEVPGSAQADQAKAGDATAADAAARVDDAYFDSYSFFDIHREMLSDKVRTEAYRAALVDNRALLRGKTVLDVGCGTGILSMFSARGGAARVVGVDGSSRMAQIATQNVEHNGLADVVTIVPGRVEELAGLPTPDGKADVLVSEWMGYALLFETMLDSVLAARDKFLKPGGAVLPDTATILVAGASAAALGLDFWDDVYGFSMLPVRRDLESSAYREALVQVVKPEALVTAPCRVQSFDLATMTAADQDFSAEFCLQASEQGARDGAAVSCHAVVLWFETAFTDRFCRERPVLLDTSPACTPTHWAQVVLTLRTPVALAGGDRLACRLVFKRNPAKHRSLDITLQAAHMPADRVAAGPATALEQASTQTQLFTMGVGAAAAPAAAPGAE